MCNKCIVSICIEASVNLCFVVCVTGCVLPGAGAFEIAAYQELMKYKDQVKGRARLGQFTHSIVVVCQNVAHVSCGNLECE